MAFMAAVLAALVQTQDEPDPKDAKKFLQFVGKKHDEAKSFVMEFKRVLSSPFSESETNRPTRAKRLVAEGGAMWISEEGDAKRPDRIVRIRDGEILDLDPGRKRGRRIPVDQVKGFQMELFLLRGPGEHLLDDFNVEVRDIQRIVEKANLPDLADGPVEQPRDRPGKRYRRGDEPPKEGERPVVEQERVAWRLALTPRSAEVRRRILSVEVDLDPKTWRVKSLTVTDPGERMDMIWVDRIDAEAPLTEADFDLDTGAYKIED